MTPDGETQLIKRVDQIHEYLVGNPLADPPKQGLIQQHNANTKAIETAKEDVEGLKKWRTEVKLRVAYVAGGITVAGVLFDRAWEWIVNHK